MENSALTLIGPFKQVITLTNAPIRGAIKNDELSILENAGIVTKDGMIQEIGSYEELASKHTEVSDWYINQDMIAFPGFIDSHTHLCFGGSRHLDYSARNEGVSYIEIARRGGGIWDTVTKTRAAESTELYEQAAQRIMLCARNGVTTVEVKTGYGLNVEEEVRMLEVIQKLASAAPLDVVSTCLAAHIKPKDFEGGNEEYLSYLGSELLPKIKERDLSNRVDIFVEEDAFTVEQSRTYLNFAKELGFEIIIHGDQFSPGGSKLAVEMGALSVDHLEASGEAEIQALAKSEVVATVLPGASLGLGITFSPARKLLDAGACLAIASDWNPGSGPMGDLLTQAAILGAYENLTDAEVFAGLTFRAAKALGYEDRGRLAPGLLADLCAFEASDYREILYHQGQLKPRHLWKNGMMIF